MSEIRVTTGKARFLYANVWTPKKNESGKEVYSVTLIIPKSDTATIEKINNAIADAYAEYADAIKGSAKSVPALADIRTPLRDGDEERESDENFAGSYFINASSIYPPGIFDADRNQITDKEEVYSGCFGRASISFFGYNRKGGRGISCGLRGLQKLEDGEKLGGFASVADDFND